MLSCSSFRCYVFSSRRRLISAIASQFQQRVYIERPPEFRQPRKKTTARSSNRKKCPLMQVA